MTPTPELQERIRRYLLGQLSDGAREEIEQDLLANEELFEELLVAEDELIDAYLGGKLNADQRASFEKHFLATPERHEKLKFGQAFDRYLSSQESEKPANQLTPSRTHRDLEMLRSSQQSSLRSTYARALFSSPLRVAALAIVVVVLAFTGWRIFFHESDVDKGLLALNAAYREQRPVEARISSFSYAPFSQTRGGPDRVDSLARTRAEAILSNAVNDSPSAAAPHHALGKVYLANKRFDEAIKEFDEALKSDPKNAQLYSDLGAAWLERGKVDVQKAKTDSTNSEAGISLEELARSLGYLTTALELDTNLREALFNRALCHQYMFQTRAAEADWQEYLKRDSASRWADEARQNLKLLQNQQNNRSRTKQQMMEGFLNAKQLGDEEKAFEILGQSRDDLAGTNVAQQLLGASLESVETSDESEVIKNAQALAYLGDIERRRSGEYYNNNLASYYGNLSRTQQAQLTQAHLSMQSGYEHYRDSKLSDAIYDFTKAQQSFDKANDHEESGLAQYWVGYCHAEAGETRAALAIFERLADDFQNRHYQWLLMRTLTSISSARFSLNEYSKAIDFCVRALKLAEVIGDLNGAFNALDALTEIHRSLNNYPQALSYAERSLPLADCCPFNSVKLWRHYSIIASTLSSAGLDRAAVDYQKEALERALAMGETSTVCVSYANLGSMCGKLGDYDEGVRNAKAAYDLAAQRQNDSTGKEMMAYASLQIGHLYRESGECEKAIENYDRSVALYNDLEFPVLAYQAHKGRLSCYLAQTNTSLAIEEIQATLDLAEKYRSTILESDNRNNFFRAEQTVYDLATDFAYSKLHDPEQAFNHAERSRARSLLDSMNSRPIVVNGGGKTNLRFEEAFRSLPLSKIELGIPDKVQIVEYSVLADKVLIGIVDHQGLKTTESPVAQTELEREVQEYLNYISSPSDANDDHARALARELYDDLISPAESLLDKEKQIVVIPDKFLNLLPFYALMSPTNRYLIEDYCVSYAPSATVFLRAVRNTVGKPVRRSEHLLSVGDPAFDHAAFPFLADLPAAAWEAREITQYYEPKQSLVGPAALKAAVEREMIDADVVNFATHAINEDESGLRSKLVLAKPKRMNGVAGKDDGSLSAYEIYDLNLPLTRVVVLSSCQSGTGRNYAGEGTFSLARSFLVTGVPLVIASLWAVDSESTAQLMIDFHRRRTQCHLSSADALRKAQLAMLARPDQHYRRPYYWAPFFAIGGYADF